MMSNRKSVMFGVLVFVVSAFGFSLFDAAVPEGSVRMATKGAVLATILALFAVTVALYNLRLRRAKR